MHNSQLSENFGWRVTQEFINKTIKMRDDIHVHRSSYFYKRPLREAMTAFDVRCASSRDGSGDGGDGCASPSKICNRIETTNTQKDDLNLCFDEYVNVNAGLNTLRLNIAVFYHDRFIFNLHDRAQLADDAPKKWLPRQFSRWYRSMFSWGVSR